MNDIIVMIHGMWTGSWVWENYKPFFEKKDYLCITPTLRYHNENDNIDPNSKLGTTSIADYVNDIERLIRKFNTPPVLIGHSMGGLIAQILASRGLAKAVVLLSPASPSGIMNLRPTVIKSFWSTLSTWAFWKKPMKQTFDEAVYACLGRLADEKREAVYNRMSYESGRVGFEIGFWFFDYKKTTRIDASTISCPMLIMAGAEDRITPVTVTRRISNKYKSIATYREFEGHAHWLMGEPGWENLAEDILSWMTQVAAPATSHMRPKNEQRQHKRIDYHSPVIYSLPESPIQHQSEIDNYSLNGVKLVSAIPLTKGSNIDMKLLDTAPGFEGPEANCSYCAEVIWCKESRHENNYDIGIRFCP